MVNVIGYPKEPSEKINKIINHVKNKYKYTYQNDVLKLWKKWTITLVYDFIIEERNDYIYIKVFKEKRYKYCYDLALWIEDNIHKRVVIESDWSNWTP